MEKKPLYFTMEDLKKRKLNKYQACVLIGLESRRINAKIKSGSLETKTKAVTLGMENTVSGKVTVKEFVQPEEEKQLTF